MSEVEPLSVTVEDGVGRIELNRPDKANALTTPMLRSFQAHLAGWVADHGVRCIVISAAGRNFCAGRDMNEPLEEDGGAVIEREYNPLVRLIWRYPKPVIARVQGAAAGGGVGLALAADLTVAADDASFRFPFGRLGAIADCGAHAFLSWRLGDAVARRVLLLDEELRGADAARMGLIARSVPADRLDQEVADLAGRLAAGPTLAIEETLQLLDYAHTKNLTQVLLDEAEAVSRVGKTDDHHEGVQAYTERREPRFIGH